MADLNIGNKKADGVNGAVFEQIENFKSPKAAIKPNLNTEIKDSFEKAKKNLESAKKHNGGQNRERCA